MRRKPITTAAVAAALILSVGCVTAAAAEPEGYSYLTGQQRGASYNK